MKVKSVVGCSLALVMLSGLSLALFCKDTDSNQTKSDRSPAATSVREVKSSVVTPVQGPSWLQRLGTDRIANTSMGQVGGRQPAAPSARQEPSLTLADGRQGGGMMGGGMMGGGMMNRGSSAGITSEQLSEMIGKEFILSGSDLYRINCQSCHGPSGKGAPPEIKSLLDPVQGASTAFIVARMQKLGRTISDSMAQELAVQAKQTILDRLQKGGKRMPSFAHLQSDEIDALLQYLYSLAGYPETGKEILVKESAARVGEHVVKGTCQTCHSATGPGGMQAVKSDGISSLASIPDNNSMEKDELQVQKGSTGMMMMRGSQLMPALPFITRDEAAAEYLYLMKYAPEP